MGKSDLIQMDKNSFQQLKIFSESLPAGNIIYEFKDKDWSVIFFNEMMGEIIGYSKEESKCIVGQTPWDLFCNEDLKLLKSAFEELISMGKQFTFKCRLNSEISSRWVRISANIIERHDDHIIISCLIIDVNNNNEDNNNKNHYNNSYYNKVDNEGLHQHRDGYKAYDSLVETNKEIFNIEYNLTLDTIESINYDFPSEYAINPNFSAEENIIIIGRYIHPDDRSQFIRFLSYKHILTSYINGVKRDFLDFRTKYNNEYTWVRLIYSVIEDSYSSHLILLMLCKKIVKQKKYDIKFTKNAQTDELTGIYNRHAFKEKAIERIKSSNEDLKSGFIIVSIDRFDKVNEEFGCSYGDNIIKNIVNSLRLTLNEDDLIGRLNGINFLIYLYNYPGREALGKEIELIYMTVSNEIKDLVNLSASMGIYQYAPNGMGFDELYKKANIALSYAKKSDKNKYIVYTEKLEKTFHLVSPNKEDEEDNYNNKRVEIRTFGYFDLFIDGQAVLIPNAKAKELLALMVHRKGGFITPPEIISNLWEDEEANQVTMTRCRKIFMLLKNTLKEYGVEDILESNRGARRIITEKVNCDLYNYLSGDKEFNNLFKGFYMLNYSWGELSLSSLEENIQILEKKTNS